MNRVNYKRDRFSSEKETPYVRYTERQRLCVYYNRKSPGGEAGKHKKAAKTPDGILTVYSIPLAGDGHIYLASPTVTTTFFPALTRVKGMLG